MHPGATEAAGDLVGALQAQGVKARQLTLYETAPVSLPAERAGELTQADAVLLHSPKAAKVLAGVLKAHPAPNLRALGLSKAVVKPLARAKLGAKVFPSMPLEAALLNLIDRSS
jgi:uroporphyrinogen-III synthase